MTERWALRRDKRRTVTGVGIDPHVPHAVAGTELAPGVELVRGAFPDAAREQAKITRLRIGKWLLSP